MDCFGLAPLTWHRSRLPGFELQNSFPNVMCTHRRLRLQVLMGEVEQLKGRVKLDEHSGHYEQQEAHQR
jgi:hypothetical protein